MTRSPSIQSQIAEMRRELDLRRRTYPHEVQRRRLRQSEADQLIHLAEAVLDTLLWVQRHRDVIVAAVEAAKLVRVE